MTLGLEELHGKYSPGDLVSFESKRKFPLVLRSAPGYTSERVHIIEPGEVAVVLNSALGHGMIMWVQILVGPTKKGWIPEEIVDKLLNSI